MPELLLLLLLVDDTAADWGDTAAAATEDKEWRLNFVRKESNAARRGTQQGTSAAIRGFGCTSRRTNNKEARLMLACERDPTVVMTCSSAEVTLRGRLLTSGLLDLEHTA